MKNLKKYVENSFYNPLFIVKFETKIDKNEFLLILE